MTRFQGVNKAIIFAGKTEELEPYLKNEGCAGIALNQNTYLELKAYDNVFYKKVIVRGNVPCMITLSKKFNLFEQKQIATYETIAIVPKDSKYIKKYKKDAKNYLQLLELFEKNEEAKKKRDEIKAKLEDIEKKMSSVKKNLKEDKHALNEQITQLKHEKMILELSKPKISSMMNLLKIAGIKGSTDDSAEKSFARLWKPIGSFKDFYVFQYDFVNMMNIFIGSVERGKEVRGLLEDSLNELPNIPAQSFSFSARQSISRNFLEVLSKNNSLFENLPSLFIHDDEQETVPPLLPPSSGNIINLLFSGVLNGEMDTEDMGKVLVKGSTIKKARRVNDYMIDSLSQELYVFKMRDYSILKESVL